MNRRSRPTLRVPIETQRDCWDSYERSATHRAREEKPRVPAWDCVAGVSCGTLGHERTVLRADDPFTLAKEEAEWRCPECGAAAVFRLSRQPKHTT